MSAKNDRIAMLARGGRSTSIVYNALASEFPVERVILEEPISKRVFLQRRAKKLGVFKVFGQVLFQALAVPVLESQSAGRLREIEAEYGLDATPPPAEKTAHVSSANADETIELLCQIDPAVVVVNGTRILSERVLTCVPATFVNMHAGITPAYRGVHGAYWALVRGDRERCGVTVHVVDTGIDTGSILRQGLVEPGPKDNFATYSLLQVGVGTSLLRESVREILADRAQPQPHPPGDSALWSHPTLLEYLRHRIVRGVR